jgi:hypothetical protein
MDTELTRQFFVLFAALLCGGVFYMAMQLRRIAAALEESNRLQNRRSVG